MLWVLNRSTLLRQDASDEYQNMLWYSTEAPCWGKVLQMNTKTCCGTLQKHLAETRCFWWIPKHVVFYRSTLPRQGASDEYQNMLWYSTEAPCRDKVLLMNTKTCGTLQKHLAETRYFWWIPKHVVVLYRSTLPRQGASDEYQNMVFGEIRKISVLFSWKTKIKHLIWSYDFIQMFCLTAYV